MKKYDAYKDSGIEWIGEIPEHWKVSYYKHVCEIQNGFPFKSQLFSNEKGMPLLRIRDITSGNIETYYTGDYSEDYVVDNGSLLVGMDGDFNIRWWDKGKALLNQRCCNVIEKGNIELRFLYYLLPFDLEIINDLTYYTTVKHLSNGDINNSKICIPSLSEQKSITSFLDHKTTQIDTLIEKKEQLVEKLTLKRQAIINEAVTKGLNPDVPMKDSGIEWLGEVPEHWDLLKIGRSFSSIGSGTTPKSTNSTYYNEGNINWLNTGDLNDSYITETSKKITQTAVDEFSTLKEYPIDSIVIALYGATIGKLGHLKIPTTTNQACCVISGSDKIQQRFLFYYFLAARNYIISLSYGGGQPNISQDLIRQLYIPTPTNIEQDKIIFYLDHKTTQIDNLIEKINTSIDKLKLYRQSLISEAVTGKMDLRDWKATDNK